VLLLEREFGKLAEGGVRRWDQLLAG
jgi:hypothetical protein